MAPVSGRAGTEAGGSAAAGLLRRRAQCLVLIFISSQQQIRGANGFVHCVCTLNAS